MRCTSSTSTAPAPGAPVNLEHVRADRAPRSRCRSSSAAACATPTTVEAVLAAGAERVVLGTAALRDPALVEALAAEHGERIVVSVDARGGKVAVEGWSARPEPAPPSVIAELARRGVRRFVFTPVEVDGTLRGARPRVAARGRRGRAATGAELIYSGGVGTLDDLRALAALGLDRRP